MSTEHGAKNCNTTSCLEIINYFIAFRTWTIYEKFPQQTWHFTKNNCQFNTMENTSPRLEPFLNMISGFSFVPANLQVMTFGWLVSSAMWPIALISLYLIRVIWGISWTFRSMYLVLNTSFRMKEKWQKNISFRKNA